MDSRVCRLRTVVMRIYSLWYMVWCYDVCSTVRKRIYWIFDIYFAHSVLLRLYPQYQQTNHSCNMPSWSKNCVFMWMVVAVDAANAPEGVVAFYQLNNKNGFQQ